MELPHYGSLDGGPIIHLRHEPRHAAPSIRPREFNLAKDAACGVSGFDGHLTQESEVEGERWKVFLKVLRGQDLAVADDSFLWFWGSSDPFVEIKYKEKRYVSHVEPKNLNPEWNMKRVNLGIVDETDDVIVEINVWDHDTSSSDDFLGCVLVSLGGVCRLGPGRHRHTLQLGPSPFPDIKPKNGISGSICLEFEVVSVASSDTPTASPFSSV